MKGHAELRSEINKKKKELEQLEQAKMKEFNKAAKALFDKVDGINEKAREYYAGLAEATKSQETK